MYNANADGRQYHPDFESACRVCGTIPCVIVYDSEARRNSETELCGCCFFSSRFMIDWNHWNLVSDD
jgi:hypothetical protein